jgi:Cof subfamily protein (haloacid dehalogenase superfamily)
MIKLVASDMDGTLLNEKSQVPPETYDLIGGLYDRGVRFVASSGRRLDTLREFFEPVVDKMDFVASNGAQVMVGGELVDREVFSHMMLRRVKSVVDMFDCLHLAVFDSTRSFLLDDPSCFELEFDKDLRRAERIDDIPRPEVSIIKASIFCDRTDYVMDMAYVLERELGDRMVFAPSGRRWIDVMQKGVSKATGIKQVLVHYGIDPADAVAFGDSMNDYEILRLVGHPRAMSNGRYAIQQVSERIVGSNVEHAVQRELARMIEQVDSERAAQ